MKPRISWKTLGLVAALAAFVGQSAVRAQPPGQVVPARVSELERPIAMLQEAKRNYGAVKDYTCTLVSQERVHGQLGEENYIQLKLKTQPFSVYMRWMGPKSLVGQEAAFVLGKNDNKMRVKSNALLVKAVGFVSIDVNDPRVLKHSRHTILETGIGNMIDQSIVQWEKERPLGKTKVDIREYNYAKRDCYRIELTRTEQNPVFTAFRTVTFLEKVSKLPIRVENYDWPRQGGPVGGDLLEMFSYVNLQFNTDLKDAEFVK